MLERERIFKGDIDFLEKLILGGKKFSDYDALDSLKSDNLSTVKIVFQNMESRFSADNFTHDIFQTYNLEIAEYFGNVIDRINPYMINLSRLLNCHSPEFLEHILKNNICCVLGNEEFIFAIRPGNIENVKVAFKYAKKVDITLYNCVSRVIFNGDEEIWDYLYKDSKIDFLYLGMTIRKYEKSPDPNHLDMIKHVSRNMKFKDWERRFIGKFSDEICSAIFGKDWSATT